MEEAMMEVMEEVVTVAEVEEGMEVEDVNLYFEYLLRTGYFYKEMTLSMSFIRNSSNRGVFS